MDMWPGIENTGIFKGIKKTLEQRVPIHMEEPFVILMGGGLV